MYKLKVVMRFMFTIKTWYWGMTYNIYIYAYTHIDIISSLMKFEGIKWLALSKYTQKWSTEIAGLRDAKPTVANAPGGVRVTTPSAANDDKDDPYACVYCNRTNATNERVANAQILDCCNRYRYISNRRYTTTYPTSNRTYNYFNRYKILYVS